MRIIFMGTPEFAVPSLEAALAVGIEVAAVVTAPDKPSGRGQKIRETAVKQCAVKHCLPILQPEKLKDPKFLQQLQNLHADLFVVVAFRMLPEEVWNMPPLGTVNLHASLLPQYRGAAPINWAIINGETKTGTTVFFIEKEIDTGNVLSYREQAILPEDNAGSLHDRLMIDGAQHLADTLLTVAVGNYTPVPQKTEDTLHPAPKISKETCAVNWQQDVVRIHCLVRGLSPYPCAWTTIVSAKGEKTMLKIHETELLHEPHAVVAGTLRSDGKKYLHIAASGGWIVVKKLQPEGKKRMDTVAFLCGLHEDISTFRAI
ncbi:MAG: methionyl-tRNA formyltransferase [Bacteroidales bacterium]|jgi:methionyl-tRNA formyltransferase|nr:methionyl-tRNA formyltransferase [Bacteroidales bacterium]